MSDDEEIRMGDEELEISNMSREDLSRGLLPAASGWEFLYVVFREALNAPDVYRYPIIAWEIGGDAAMPIFPYPWSSPSKKWIELETEYKAYLCPDGSVVGYHGLLEEHADLQRFIDICTIMESAMLLSP